MDDLLIRREQAESVRRAVEQLPTDFREVIVLRKLEERSYKDLAAVVTVPVGPVRSRLSRARKHWKPLLGAVRATGDRT
jgi:RNA polymerase sigma factor (sigma-70 family)